MSKHYPSTDYRESTCYVEASHARMLAARAEALALLAVEAASGTHSLESLTRSVRDGSSSKTFRAEPDNGSTPFAETYTSAAMRAFRSRFRRMIAEHFTFVPEYLLLPTLTASRYGTQNNGSPHDGTRTAYATRGKASLWTLARRAGGTLSPLWCEWFMGFPATWTEPAKAH